MGANPPDHLPRSYDPDRLFTDRPPKSLFDGPDLGRRAGEGSRPLGELHWSGDGDEGGKTYQYRSDFAVGPVGWKAHDRRRDPSLFFFDLWPVDLCGIEIS